jgi:hypothetical protein
MVGRFLKEFLPGPIKRFAKMQIGRLGSPDVAYVDQEQIRQELLAELTQRSYGFAPAAFDPGASERSYGRFIADYQRVLAQDADAVQAMRQAYPIATTFCDDLLRFYEQCNKIDGHLKESMKRMAYTMVPYFHASAGMHSSNVKSTLPWVGLLPSLTSNRGFVGDALNGSAQIEELYPERIISDTWSSRPHAYPVLKDMVAKSLTNLSADFCALFPDRDFLVERVTQQIQLELGLYYMLRQKDYKLVIAGNAGMGLPLALFDMPRGDRPPVAYFEHGIVYGDPYHSMYARAEHFIVTGRRDREIWQALGADPSTMLTVGCITQDFFPSFEYVETMRAQARLRQDLKADTPAIVYALDWHADLISRPSCADTQKLIIKSLEILANEHNIKPVLFLKYHPSPGEPFFYKSRVDYPLHHFLELEKCGITVRLASDLDSYLPLADCYMAHESTTLGDAIGAAVATLSLDYNQMEGRPTLDRVAYEPGSAHRLSSLRHQPEQIAQSLKEVLSAPRDVVYESSKKVWHNLYDCGRTEGLARFGKFFRDQFC